jgi:2-dehydropantoate 2-reductase
VILGAGAIGGVIGGRLAQHGRDVLLIARGAHYAAIRDHGLKLASPDEAVEIDLPVIDDPTRVKWTGDDVLLIATKTQDTEAALDGLRTAPPELPILCAQNGVANERMAAERFNEVYGIFVWCPADYLVPGQVQVWSSPTSGLLHVGRYPSGSDTRGEAVAEAFRASSFIAEAKTDIMRWKYRKLLSNLGNAVDALCGRSARASGLYERARAEGVACLAAAGISFVADDEQDAKTLESQVQARTIGGQHRRGGSSWQSLERKLGSIETDYLNGEIVELGKRHGVPTPLNAVLQRLSQEAARDQRAPGSIDPGFILSKL